MTEHTDYTKERAQLACMLAFYLGEKRHFDDTIKVMEDCRKAAFTHVLTFDGPLIDTEIERNWAEQWAKSYKKTM